MQDDSVDVKAWLTLLFLSVIWGSSFILMKKALVAFEPIQLAAMRLVITGVALSPMLYIYRSHLKRSQAWKYLYVGMVGNGIPAVLFFFAQTQISSSLSGLLNSLTPIWTLILGILFFTQPFLKMQVGGVILGFIGASILILASGSDGPSSNTWYSVLVVIATILYGLSGNLVTRYFKDTPSALISAGSLGSVGIIAAIYLLLFDMPTLNFSDEAVRYSFGALVILSLVGTALATIVFYKLILRTSAVFGSVVAYIMPIVAIAWGVLDGETIHGLHLVGMILILIGVYIVRRKKKYTLKNQ